MGHGMRGVLVGLVVTTGWVWAAAWLWVKAQRIEEMLDEIDSCYHCKGEVALIIDPMSQKDDYVVCLDCGRTQ